MLPDAVTLGRAYEASGVSPVQSTWSRDWLQQAVGLQQQQQRRLFVLNAHVARQKCWVVNNTFKNIGNTSGNTHFTEGLQYQYQYFLQRAAMLACKRCTSYSISVRPSVRPSVCHMPVLCQNDGT